MGATGCMLVVCCCGPPSTPTLGAQFHFSLIEFPGIVAKVLEDRGLKKKVLCPFHCTTVLVHSNRDRQGPHGSNQLTKFLPYKILDKQRNSLRARDRNGYTLPLYLARSRVDNHHPLLSAQSRHGLYLTASPTRGRERRNAYYETSSPARRTRWKRTDWKIASHLAVVSDSTKQACTCCYQFPILIKFPTAILHINHVGRSAAKCVAASTDSAASNITLSAGSSNPNAKNAPTATATSSVTISSTAVPSPSHRDDGVTKELTRGKGKLFANEDGVERLVYHIPTQAAKSHFWSSGPCQQTYIAKCHITFLYIW
ncbi:hypothetical protein ACRALDRAFT_211507 [Sodiomyces alcalophilus JCM 7366]|uniref:uncharacterized protein n=1 Tax=Sodiomyces alcalophilus JCM 7366 TaxID=591952 RepID=UPI0039B4C9A5